MTREHMLGYIDPWADAEVADRVHREFLKNNPIRPLNKEPVADAESETAKVIARNNAIWDAVREFGKS